MDEHGKLFLKKAGVKLELLTNNDMLMMVEKGIRAWICHAKYRYAKSNNKYMKTIVTMNYHISLFRCMQIVWMGNVSKITCKWF